MKKLLCSIIILAVAGFASMATAGLSIYVDDGTGMVPAESSEILLLPSETIWLGVYSDGTVDSGRHSGALVITSGPGNWTGNTIDHAQIPGGAVFVTGPAGIFIQNNWNPITTLGPGLWSEFEFRCDGMYHMWIQLFDDLYGPQDTYVIRGIIPEPMTISLLGLGALGLRRRKI